jgi:hypothetical protein
MLVLALAWFALPGSFQAAPTIASLEGFPPQVVGELVLSGREHRAIEAVKFPTFAGPPTPGVVAVDLVEQAASQSGGCVRRRWRAAFRLPALDSPEGAAVFDRAYPITEVALPSDPGCAEGEFVHVNPGLAVEEALRALDHLADVRSGNAEVHFSCTDSTGSNLCQSDQRIMQELASLPAWAVTTGDSTVEVWLGDRGQAVTRVIFSNPSSVEVTVERRIPAPF